MNLNEYNIFNQNIEELEKGNNVIMDLPNEIKSTEDVLLYLTYISRVFNEIENTFDESGEGGTFVPTRDNRTLRELCQDTQYFVNDVKEFMESKGELDLCKIKN